MAEDRFANVFSAELTLSAANVVTFAEMNFGITLRDRVAIVIDELYFYWTNAAIAEMTATGDFLTWALSVSDQPTSFVPDDRRLLYIHTLLRHDMGTAAAGAFVQNPLKAEFNPPLIALPNRLFLGGVTGGLASAAVLRLRMHFRTVSITQDQQLVEVLEAFQLST